MSLFLASCCIAVVFGVCSYLSLVRPCVRAPERTLMEVRMLEAWWRLDASTVSVAAADDDRLEGEGRTARIGGTNSGH